MYILSLLHPFFSDNFSNWLKWRITYEGGSNFIYNYLYQLSRRESEEDFKLRRKLTYCPAFAKAAVNEIKNSIFQRITDITRKGGPKSFLDAAEGYDDGVDNAGNSMNSYIGRHILPELLTMARVAIYVDMPVLTGTKISDKGDARPYIYLYRTEQIRSWSYDFNNPDLLRSILLEDYDYDYDPSTGLTKGIITKYRHMWIDEAGLIQCQYYDSSGSPLEQITLDIERIPVVILELTSSLLCEAADYQIALLNLESSDLFYALKSNFPFYTEQFDPRTENPYLKSNSEIVNGTKSIELGASSGRRYPIGTERPGFINPSPDPLRISMEKANQLKKDIRQLVHLSVQNLEPRRASADSKLADERTLETGLSYIGLELEHAERQIAWLWAKYEGSAEITTINYPEDYVLVSTEERKSEADRLEKLIPEIPSKTFQKEATKRIVDLTIGNIVTKNILEKINNEIDTSTVIHSDPDIITKDLENGLVSTELASKIRGYPPSEVEKAKQEHIERLSAIAIAQSQGAAAELKSPMARGVSDLSANDKEAKEEKAMNNGI